MGGLPPSSTGGFLSGVRGVFPDGAPPSDTIRKRPIYYVNISVMNRASYSVGQECEHGDWNCKRCGKNHLVPRALVELD